MPERHSMHTCLQFDGATIPSIANMRVQHSSLVR